MHMPQTGPAAKHRCKYPHTHTHQHPHAATHSRQRTTSNLETNQAILSLGKLDSNLTYFAHDFESQPVAGYPDIKSSGHCCLCCLKEFFVTIIWALAGQQLLRPGSSVQVSMHFMDSQWWSELRRLATETLLNIFCLSRDCCQLALC